MVNVRIKCNGDESYRRPQLAPTESGPNHWFEPPNYDGRAETSAFLFFLLFILIWFFLLFLRLFIPLYILFSKIFHFSISFLFPIRLHVRAECVLFAVSILTQSFVIFSLVSFAWYSTLCRSTFLSLCTKSKRQNKEEKRKGQTLVPVYQAFKSFHLNDSITK